MMRGFDFVGFDLDGTLIDSKPAVVDCLRHVAPFFRIGDIDALVDVLFPLSLDEFRKVLQIEDDVLWTQFRKMYVLRFDSTSYKLVRPVEGAFDALDYCSHNFRRQNMFVLTNRRLESADAILTLLGMRDCFATVSQAQANMSVNPKIAALAALLSERRQGDRGLYIGDHIKDAEAAIANGLQAVLVGHGTDARVVHKEPNEQIITLENLGQLAVILETENASGCEYFQKPLRARACEQPLG